MSDEERGGNTMPGRRLLSLAAFLGLVVPSLATSGAEAASTPSPKRTLAQLAEDSTRPLVARNDPGERLPSFVTGRIPVGEFSSRQAPAERGWDFWGAYGRAFGVADPRGELVLRSVERDELGMTHLAYDQRHRGLPVFGRRMLIHLDGDVVTAVNGEFAAGIEVSPTPAVSANEARDAARAVPARALRPPEVEPELLVFVDGAERARLAWRVSIVSGRPLGLWRVYIDAMTGDVLRFYNDLRTAKDRQTHHGGNDPDCNTQDAPQCVLPGALARGEGAPPTGDAVVNAAHDLTGVVYDYYSTAHGRDSYDDAGHHMRSTVHFGVGYNNAFWCPNIDCADLFGSTPDGEQMVYGDGDGVVFSPLGSDIDVVAHELTHAVTENEADLVYLDQSGALNESYSDVFAAMVDTDNWLIGEDSFTPAIAGDALRDMSDPSAQGQPEHMSEFVETVGDNGGVHINSGIPNHAAYLTSEDAGYGIGRAATEDIYYRALTVYLTPSSDFLDNLNALLVSADDLFPGDDSMTTAVASAQAAVGIANLPAVTFPDGGEELPTGSPTMITWTTDDNARPFEVSYLQDLGSAAYNQGFEASASLPGEFSTGGNQPWLVDGTTAATGVRSARSGTITHNQRSELTLIARMASAGSVTFNARVSSENGFDFFSFHVDGQPMVTGSGNIPWGPAPPTMVPAGTHTLTFVYEKDFIVSSGSDRAWIDDLIIPNVESVALTTVNASTATGATSQAWTPPSISDSNFKVRVETLGVAPWYSTDDSDGTFSITGGVPETTITGGPAAATNDSTPTFTFTSTDPANSTFECRVDADPFAPCTSPHTTPALADGDHTFEVQAATIGGTDPTPDSQAFTVDTDPPEATITSGPSGTTDDSTPTFGFSSDEPGSTFECRVDAVPFAACTSPHTTAALAPGAHTFQVRATDEAGNAQTTPASRAFTVTSPPQPVPAFSIGNAKRKEPDRGKKMMKFRVSLSGAATAPVTVDFATKNGSAGAPKDYKAVQGTLTFAPGTTVQVIKVPIKGDLRDERNEKFSVLLSGPTGATIADGTGTGRIKDND
jgi:thermolysin